MILSFSTFVLSIFQMIHLRLKMLQKKPIIKLKLPVHKEKKNNKLLKPILKNFLFKYCASLREALQHIIFVSPSKKFPNYCKKYSWKKNTFNKIDTWWMLLKDFLVIDGRVISWTAPSGSLWIKDHKNIYLFVCSGQCYDICLTGDCVTLFVFVKNCEFEKKST